MREEDFRIQKAMEISDLPKLGSHFNNSRSFAGIAWEIYKANLNKMTKYWKWKTIKNAYYDSNPLISFFTWTVMVPVGGSFCIFGWYMLFLLYRRKVKINKTTYAMNQYQKKAFLQKKFKSSPLNKEEPKHFIS
ncbi:unnamed protein product [Blepharisma stoltei]|uniref:Transmembrane protein n=1 Tax=Blepharisma stoltei TaxID=1481888 RepID=A0AAU9KER7_9CILI|nr:unnamed protein product [Blepharisma stoltei]